MFPDLGWIAATAAAQEAAPGGGGSLTQVLFPMLVVFGIFYFVWFRPASKERKEREDLLKALKRGDEVLTTSGMFGTVTDIAEREVTVEVARNTKIRMLKSAVAQNVTALKAKKSESTDKTDKGTDKAGSTKSTKASS